MMADATNAEELLARVASGDEEALRLLYDAFRPRLRNYLWRQLHGDGSAVEEALQDVFMAVWRTAASYRDEARGDLALPDRALPCASSSPSPA
jgi:RNA polymerase sigma-70 factor, ECF subfamily